MGDKSPKSKAKEQKQDSKHKNQQKAASVAKSTPAPSALFKKKGK